MPTTRDRFDVMGLLLSGSCLVHCLVLPVAVLAAPSLAAWLGRTETAVHWALFAVALGVSGWALRSGYRRHGILLVGVVGAVGLGVMGVAAAHLFGSGAEAVLTVVGASIVALAHVVNLRLTVSAGEGSLLR